MAIINKLEDIADAIREKTGENGLMTMAQMPSKIRSIETGTENIKKWKIVNTVIKTPYDNDSSISIGIPIELHNDETYRIKTDITHTGPSSGYVFQITYPNNQGGASWIFSYDSSQQQTDQQFTISGLRSDNEILHLFAYSNTTNKLTWNINEISIEQII